MSPPRPLLGRGGLLPPPWQDLDPTTRRLPGNPANYQKYFSVCVFFRVFDIFLPPKAQYCIFGRFLREFFSLLDQLFIMQKKCETNEKITQKWPIGGVWAWFDIRPGRGGGWWWGRHPLPQSNGIDQSNCLCSYTTLAITLFDVQC